MDGGDKIFEENKKTAETVSHIYGIDFMGCLIHSEEWGKCLQRRGLTPYSIHAESAALSFLNLQMDL